MADEPEKPKKALHEYTREFTEEEVAKASEMLASNATIRAVAKELNLTVQRAGTLLRKIEVQQTAIKLRETKLIPQALYQLRDMVATALDAINDMNKRLVALEVAEGKTSKALVRKNFKAQRDRETINKLRNEAKELRDLIRKRGIV